MRMFFAFPVPPDSARMALYRRMFCRPGVLVKSWGFTLSDRSATDEEIAAACLDWLRQVDEGKATFSKSFDEPDIVPICMKELVALVDGGMGWDEAAEKLRNAAITPDSHPSTTN